MSPAMLLLLAALGLGLLGCKPQPEMRPVASAVADSHRVCVVPLPRGWPSESLTVIGARMAYVYPERVDTLYVGAGPKPLPLVNGNLVIDGVAYRIVGELHPLTADEARDFGLRP